MKNYSFYLCSFYDTANNNIRWAIDRLCDERSSVVIVNDVKSRKSKRYLIFLRKKYFSFKNQRSMYCDYLFVVLIVILKLLKFTVFKNHSTFASDKLEEICGYLNMHFGSL